MRISWKRSLLIFELLILLINTGCWSYRDVEEMFIAAGAAIDLTESGSYKLTTEIVDITASGGGSAEIESAKVESTGETVSDAVNNAIKKVEKEIYWADAQVIIISEAAAKKGIMPIMDWVLREHENRLTLYIAISKQKTAKELFETQSIGTSIHSFEMARILENAKHHLGEASVLRVYEIANDIAEEGLSATMPAFQIVTNAGREKVELSGTAMFSKDMLIGYLNSEESKYFNIIRDTMDSGLLTITYPPQTGQPNISFVIIETKTDSKPALEDGSVRMKISSKAKVSVNNNYSSKEADSKGVSELQDEVEKMLQSNMLGLIRKIQNEYGTDIFGFGNEIKEDMPALWRQYEEDWSSIFKTLPVDIKCDVEIVSNGEIKKLPIGD